MQLADMIENQRSMVFLRQEHVFRIGLISVILVVSAVVFLAGNNNAGPHSTSHVLPMKRILHHKTIVPGDEITLEKPQHQGLSYHESSSSAASNDLIEDDPKATRTSESMKPSMLEKEIHDDPFFAMRRLKKESKKVKVRFSSTKSPAKGRMRPVFEESGKGKGGGRSSRAPSGRRNGGKGKQAKSSGKGKQVKSSGKGKR